MKITPTGEGKAKLENLPEALEHYMFNFTEADVAEFAKDVLDCVITMNDARSNVSDLVQNIPPSEDEFKSKIETYTKIKESDPSKHYDIVGKLGQGGFAKVFKVKRKNDGLICALKFVEPKNESERKIIINEIGIMQMC